MEYKIIRPYGPTIYHGRLTEDEITYLQGVAKDTQTARNNVCLLYTSPSPRDATLSRMPSSA